VAHLPGYAAEYMTLGSGPPIVLVPGLAGGYEMLRPLATELAKHFTVVTYQLRGEDDPLAMRRGMSLEMLTRDLTDFLDYLRLERPAVLGVSFGTAVAMDLAIRRPGRLGMLVLQGADPRFRGGLVNQVGRALLGRLLLPHNDPFVNRFFRLLFGRDEAADSLFQQVTRLCWQTDQGIMARRLGLLDGVDFERTVHRIRVPSLVMAGEHDVFASKQGHRMLLDRIPNARGATIRGAGHLAFLTQPKVLARLIRQFALANR